MLASVPVGCQLRKVGKRIHCQMIFVHILNWGRGKEIHIKGYERMRKNLKEARQKAGMTQQQMADKLNITLVYYQKIEAGDRTGDFIIWDTLEDITGIHQRKLRENLETCLCQEDNL